MHNRSRPVTFLKIPGFLILKRRAEEEGLWTSHTPTSHGLAVRVSVTILEKTCVHGRHVGSAWLLLATLRQNADEWVQGRLSQLGAGGSTEEAEFLAVSRVAWSRVLCVSKSQVSSPGKGRGGLDQGSQHTFRCPYAIHPGTKCTDDRTSPFLKTFLQNKVSLSV